MSQGETLQGRYACGCCVCCEQISHHPPISCWQIIDHAGRVSVFVFVVVWLEEWEEIAPGARGGRVNISHIGFRHLFRLWLFRLLFGSGGSSSSNRPLNLDSIGIRDPSTDSPPASTFFHSDNSAHVHTCPPVFPSLSPSTLTANSLSSLAAAVGAPPLPATASRAASRVRAVCGLHQMGPLSPGACPAYTYEVWAEMRGGEV